MRRIAKIELDANPTHDPFAPMRRIRMAYRGTGDVTQRSRRHWQTEGTPMDSQRKANPPRGRGEKSGNRTRLGPCAAPLFIAMEPPVKKPRLKAVPDHLPSPPANLSDQTMAWWRAMLREYQIADEGGLTLLGLAAEARDRMHRAAALVREHGEVIFSERVAPRPNPACAIERDARAQMIAALRELHLDVEPLHGRPGRPAGR